MVTLRRSLAAMLGLLGLGLAYETAACKCAPDDDCWPSSSTWDALNTTISGQLVTIQPVAISCYPGPLFSNQTCAVVNSNWDKCAWQAEQPAGMCQESDDLACAPIVPPAGPGQDCTHGNQPRYAVNATTPAHVAAGIKFAAENNVRLIVKTTGHDFLRRSQGYGSLEIWLRYYRTGINFQKTFQSSCGCTKTNWTGSAVKVGGGYQWSDVYAVAKANNVVVVGGGAPSIGAIGGWMQGGGFGPASHHWGIGADQVLEAKIALPDGSIVVANPCQNTDVYKAIRGGGPSTYGVVLSATYKTYPMVGVAAQTLNFGFSPGNRPQFMDALTVLYSSFPDMMDAGYAAFGFWSLTNDSLIGAAPPGYFQNAYIMNSTLAEAQAVFAPVKERLETLGLDLSMTWTSYDTYWDLFDTVSGGDDPGFPIGAIYSRFFDRKSLQDNPAALYNMIDVVAGAPEDAALHTVECMSGGKVWEDGSDPYTGVHPAWRTSYCLHAVQRAWEVDTDEAIVAAIKQDVTYVKGGVMTDLAPDTGTYMNEAGWEDPDWKANFYGAQYDRHLATKKRLDPNGVFYCVTCVASDEWAEDETGRLCRVK